MVIPIDDDPPGPVALRADGLGRDAAEGDCLDAGGFGTVRASRRSAVPAASRPTPSASISTT
jgi:hypothetical protein